MTELHFYPQRSLLQRMPTPEYTKPYTNCATGQLTKQTSAGATDCGKKRMC
ncbi:hypothetical protein LC605_29335 [Nostoc sp. CHAB 5836]|uniref:hypothetical protein n=1 Tax=Nostoc sp. CHAB 5836 TaxID=2780404 RepID=UPI001E3296E1|nr:hypothetical protein [Nostoc sp. CHAB 5836]MCC5619112.1 hypothetical protein [Nostoc sp. CHAB 5836]